MSAVEKPLSRNSGRLPGHLEGAAGQGQGIPAVLAPVLVHQDLIRPQGEGLTGGTVVVFQGDQVQLHDPAIDSRGALELAGNVQQEGILLLKGGEGGVAVAQEILGGQAPGGQGLLAGPARRRPCWPPRLPGR